MTDSVTDGAVASTVLFLNKVWQSATVRRLVDAHRFMTQHQLTITSPNVITGTFQVRIIPDTADAVLMESVNTGLELAVNGRSAMLLFSGVLRGIELVETEAFGDDTTMTIVLSSTRGQA